MNPNVILALIHDLQAEVMALREQLAQANEHITNLTRVPDRMPEPEVVEQ